VVLFTVDGGERWKRLGMNAMPGLNAVRFLDEKTGYVVGDGTDQFPSGVFSTNDSGMTWKPLPGPRSPGWKAAHFTGPDTAALVGAWNHLASIRRGQVVPAKIDTLGGRTVNGIYQGKEKNARTVAVGQGGLILLSDDAGARWSFPELLLPGEVLSCWDLRAVHGAGRNVWAAGRPGSVLLHSPDAGKTWEMVRTGQTLPLNGIYFHDEKNGWAVGELGTILATADGGKSWKVQHSGGKRAGVMLLNARGTGIPMDVVTRLGDDGVLTTALRIVSADPATARPRRAGDADRLGVAIRLAGGASGESLWQMPLSSHLATQPREAVLRVWDDLHGGKAGEQLLRQLVLAIRVWRPDVILSDSADAKDAPLEGLMAEAVREAFKRAADPKAFPEQLSHLGLREWKAAKLYAPGDEKSPDTIIFNNADVKARLQSTVREFAAQPASVIAGEGVTPPRRRALKLTASSIASARPNQGMFEGIPAAKMMDARRKVGPTPEITPELSRALHSGAVLKAIAEMEPGTVTEPQRIIGSLGSMLENMPDAQAAQAAHGIASHMARLGQWELAREAYLLMADRFPAHPLTADAYRWLIRHNSSSETRRRSELGQFILSSRLRYQATEPPADQTLTPAGKKKVPQSPGLNAHLSEKLQLVRFGEAAVRWYRGSLLLEPNLKSFGPLLSEDPGMQFCLQAARRNLGDFQNARKWYNDFIARQPAGPWRDAAASELWLTRPAGSSPKPYLVSKETETRPFLDGKFDDRCWKDAQPVELKDAVGTTQKAAPTKAMFAFDKEYLYVAVRCDHPEGGAVAPVKKRTRDADLRKFDRVSIFLDLDRDYATAFELSFDQRGCVRESCWGDPSWNPKMHVAVHTEATGWQIEAAIPLVALTGDVINTNRAWACHVVRTLPGKGVQSFSLPAGVPEDDPRLEGMGLMLFKVDNKAEVKRRPSPMQQVP
jgi:hypothetical protein